jgi:hypothetical protein
MREKFIKMEIKTVYNPGRNWERIFPWIGDSVYINTTKLKYKTSLEGTKLLWEFTFVFRVKGNIVSYQWRQLQRYCKGEKLGFIKYIIMNIGGPRVLINKD